MIPPTSLYDEYIDRSKMTELKRHLILLLERGWSIKKPLMSVIKLIKKLTINNDKIFAKIIQIN